MSLREQQKAERTQRILDAAAGLFANKGFESVKAEEVAELAKLSVGTLYNYFGGKNEVLMTLTALENERLVALGAEFQIDPEATVADTFCTFIHLFFDPGNMILSKDLWREGFAISFADITSEEARRLRTSDRMLSEQVVQLAMTLQSQGRLRSDVDCAILGATLFNNANMLFFDFTRSENKSYSDVTDEISKMTKAIVSLVEPTSGARLC